MKKKKGGFGGSFLLNLRLICKKGRGWINYIGPKCGSDPLESLSTSMAQLRYQVIFISAAYGSDSGG